MLVILNFLFSASAQVCQILSFLIFLGAKLKPYFVFVAPPTQIDRLRKLISTTHKGQEGHQLSPSELQSIIDEARDIEARFGHYFDKVLPITDIDRAYQELLREINALEREPQYIPSIWSGTKG